MQTLPDFIDEPVLILSIGINPSLHSVRAGYPFAFARNRFWTALNASALIDGELTAGVRATQILSHRYGIGFTDIVKKPTRGLRDLKAADFARWTPVLVEKIERLAPRIIWFHGKVAAREFVKRTMEPAPDLKWGTQSFRICTSPCFISPNPSPANASYSVEKIVASYNELAALRDRT